MKKTSRPYIVNMTIILILLTLFFGLGCIDEGSQSQGNGGIFENEGENTSVPNTSIEQTTTSIVSKVIDGDTIELENKKKVRLLGINSPEMGQPNYIEAKDRLKDLVEGKNVTLEKDIEDEDQYGRLLRYVYINETFVNLDMVREGYAHAFIVFPNTKYSEEFEKAEAKAKDNGTGIWHLAQLENLSKCLSIQNFNFNAEGNDCENLNDEYVTFKNSCSKPINMTNWTIKDEANNIYTFSNFSLADGASFTLYTGSGIDTESSFHWNSKGKKCNAIWNNDGDVLYLRDESYRLVISYRYDGFE